MAKRKGQGISDNLLKWVGIVGIVILVAIVMSLLGFFGKDSFISKLIGNVIASAFGGSTARTPFALAIPLAFPPAPPQARKGRPPARKGIEFDLTFWILVVLAISLIVMLVVMGMTGGFKNVSGLVKGALSRQFGGGSWVA